MTPYVRQEVMGECAEILLLYVRICDETDLSLSMQHAIKMW